MYIIWIGWLYVVLMLAIGQASPVRSGMTLVFLGVLPTLFLLFVVRRRQKMKAEGLIEVKSKKNRQNS